MKVPVNRKDWESPAYESPVRLLTLIILTIVFAELLLAQIDSSISAFPSSVTALLHGAILISLLFPILYLFWLRPMILQKADVSREKIQASIYRISETALTAPNLQQLIRSIHSIIAELMPAKSFFVALYDPLTDMITFPYFVDEKDPQRMSRGAGKGLTEYVLRTGQPLSATPEKLRALMNSGTVELIGTPAEVWMGVPLKTKERTIGVLVVQSYDPKIRFREDALQILQFVSTQVAMVIERKQTEEALVESQDRYKSFVQRSSEGIWRTELEKPIPIDLPEDEQIKRLFQHAYIAECNEAMAKMYGLSRPEELVGKYIRNLMISDDPHNLEYQRKFIRSGYRQVDAESHELDKEGNAKYFLNNAVGIVENGFLIRTWGSQRDVTERKRSEEEKMKLEQQLMQSQKIDAIGHLAGGVAHDFNNTLMAITGYCDLMMMRLEPRDALYRDLSEIRKAADRGATLTRQLLAFSRKQVMTPKVMDLNVVTANMENMLRRLIGEDVQLTIVPGKRLSRVKVDPGQMEQVLMNLAVNAREAMPQGGTLTIETSNIFLDEEYTRQHVPLEPGYYVKLSVSDTGYGMDEDTRMRIFEPFFTTKENGTGLGLSTVYGIIKQSGGYIWVDSQPGRGSTFTVYFPRVSIPGDSTSPGVEAATTQNETILLVDDNEPVRASTGSILQLKGFQVLPAASGMEALQIAENHQGPIQVLITDVMMPEMSGMELAKRLQSKRPDIKVLYMSGFSEESVRRENAFDPAISFVQKPASAAILIQKIRDLLDLKDSKMGLK
jgi:PAS domain S-box-containing protein